MEPDDLTLITINLMPPLNGVVCKVGYIFNEEWIEYPFVYPPSEGGVIHFDFIPGPTPGIIFQVRIPEQTIDGVTYSEVYSRNGWFDTTPTFSETITLTEVDPDPNGNGGNGSIIFSPIAKAVAPIVVGLALLTLLK